MSNFGLSSKLQAIIRLPLMLLGLAAIAQISPWESLSPSKITF